MIGSFPPGDLILGERFDVPEECLKALALTVEIALCHADEQTGEKGLFENRGHFIRCGQGLTGYPLFVGADEVNR